jgi:hypothetical protein
MMMMIITYLESRNISVGIMTVYGLDGWSSIPGKIKEIVSTASTPALGHSEPPI